MARRWDIVALVSMGLALGVTFLLYPSLPDPVPVHFDFDGTPNGWLARRFIWALPVGGCALWALVRFSPRILPPGDRRRRNAGVAGIVATMTAIFVSAIHVVVLYVAIAPGTSVVRPVFFLVGALYVGLGLLMPRVRRNPLVGIRTAFTLTSDENWARTHRVAGYTMVAAGVVGGLAGMFGGAPGGVLAIGSFVVGALIPAGYSFVIARTNPG
jgi:uncharacterized membrane protein